MADTQGLELVQIYRKLTLEEVFLLGQAHGAFSTGQFDQGTHVVLPVHDELGLHNEVFKPLIALFDRLPSLLSAPVLAECMMGACELFALQSGLQIAVTKSWIPNYLICAVN